MTWNSLNKTIQLVEGLLESITIKAGEGMMLSFQQVNLYEDIQTVYAEACEVYDEEIILECEEKDLNGIYDPTAVRRLLENLLTNAIKYGHSEKPVTIRVENGDPKELSIAVHNFGVPIPKEKQEEIFNFLKHGKKHQSTKFRS